MCINEKAYFEKDNIAEMVLANLLDHFGIERRGNEKIVIKNLAAVERNGTNGEREIKEMGEFFAK